ncbi:nucleotide excision repair endonuclease [Priestia megaterium]|uniref:GIY-YIG domain-containing protein n=1 Tax=Priestia megaterium TaxID=1404 RepID=A0A6M6DRB4_PRIMG|nr:nucleotide excision repair endonuclease [Priestia megaterium]QJX74727.1 hypothetical protein FDZ14_00475 [Priestia megaterium]
MSFSLLSNIPSPSFTQVINKQIEPLNFPECPGVYVMVNRNDEIAYTGKAKNLRQRIHSHITSSHNKEVERDIAQHNIKEIMVFCCETELDSIVLERYFIQSNIYCGKHNIQYTSPSTKKASINKLLNKSVIEVDQRETNNLKEEIECLKGSLSQAMKTIEELKKDRDTLFNNGTKLAKQYETTQSQNEKVFMMFAEKMGKAQGDIIGHKMLYDEFTKFVFKMFEINKGILKNKKEKKRGFFHKE